MPKKGAAKPAAAPPKAAAKAKTNAKSNAAAAAAPEIAPTGIFNSEHFMMIRSMKKEILEHDAFENIESAAPIPVGIQDWHPTENLMRQFRALQTSNPRTLQPLRKPLESSEPSLGRDLE